MIQIIRKDFLKKRTTKVSTLNKKLYEVFVDTDHNNRFSHFGTLNLKMADLIKKIRTIKGTGMLRVLKIEARVYEVLSLHIQQLLSRWEVNIIGTAKDSETALSLAENNKIDIVISDINILGEMDGIDTSKIIQKKHGSQIIFITGYKDQETIIKASNIDFSGYLLKPFREDELEVLINVIIEKFHLNKSEVININEYHSHKINYL